MAEVDDNADQAEAMAEVTAHLDNENNVNNVVAAEVTDEQGELVAQRFRQFIESL